jgi:hypothetical protein
VNVLSQLLLACRRWVRKRASRSERLEIWYLERDLADLSRDYRREMSDAQGGRGEPAEVESRYGVESALVYEELEGIRTERLLRQARALRVPLPSLRPRGTDIEKEDENWTLGSTLGQWTLTDEGESRLRSAIRAEQKAGREVVAFWITIVLGFFGVATGLVGGVTGLVATQQKELSRLDHLPRLTCSVVRAGTLDSLIVSNVGSPVRKMKVDRLVLFDALPYARPDDPKLVRYVVDDYFADNLGADYEGNQRLVFGTAVPQGNASFTSAITSALVDSLSRRGLGWAAIEVGQGARVVYWDWLGTRMEEYFWGHGPAGDPMWSMDRISRTRWRQLSSTGDSLSRRGQRLKCATEPREEQVLRVVRKCVASVTK